MHLPEYRRYLAECVHAARAVNGRLNPGGHGPVHLLVADRSDHDRALAVLGLADVVLVNSTSDGLNLVAKESVAAGGGRSRLVLSRTTGVYEEIGRWTHGVHPFDVEDTAAALAGALRERGASAELVAAVDRNSPAAWVRRRLAPVAAH
jgi:trehalose 6-phosphate synthase